ncbi:hypothetical protein [Bacillus sp. REN16]|uniref:hypothetical protein n=1 Tax=Bacillus sp. REN16 TaxID=2887296 RepID=UPI001E60BD00|nr:hypothetical protein [Bacillus sp. REN16]MCC3357772.1 hypothetical protein [Bacillus sp. REN16]
MQKLKNHNVLESKRQSDVLRKSSYLNLPDLQFFNWCNQQHGLNKGVYNTIDNWFFECGMVNIHNRRINILAFLDFLSDDRPAQNQHRYIRFGPGGLKMKFQEFAKECKIFEGN